MSKIKTKFVIAILMIVSVVCLSSCNKRDDDVVNPLMEEKVDNGNVAGKISYSGGYPIYEVDPSILAYFQHYCQRNAGPKTNDYPNGENIVSSTTSMQICCPTSYMMAANCLSKSRGVSYDFSGNFLKYMVNKYPSNYKYLFTMYQHANNVDNNLFYALKSGNDPSKTNEYSRESIKGFMQNSLYNNCFVLVSLNANVLNINIVNNQLLYQKNGSNPDLTSSPSYISPNYNSGHVVLIISIEIDASGDGIVTYLDPLAKTKTNQSNRRYVKYSTLLNSMKSSSSDNNSYNAIAIGLH